jgi:acyl-CoA synthetase (AMP-forming)/AMP-acid ligase II
MSSAYWIRIPECSSPQSLDFQTNAGVKSPITFVTLRSGATVEAEDLIAYVRGQMAHFKAPKQIHFGLLPASTGKIQKNTLRESVRGSRNPNPDRRMRT